MFEAAIKKGRGIDGLVSGHKIQKPEKIKKVGTSKHVFHSLLDKYENVVPGDDGFLDSLFQPCRSAVDEVLSPEELNIFSNVLLSHYHEPKDRRTGAFLSVLIRNSFNAGYNNFEFDLKSVETLYHLGGLLKGKENKRIDLSFNLEDCTLGHFGIFSEYCNFHVIKKQGFIHGGDFAKNCCFDIEGDAGGIGEKSSDCTFVIDGDVQNCGENTYNSDFIVSGHAKRCGYGAEKSTFSVGSSGADTGGRSRYSSFHIEKDADQGLGWFASDSSFYVGGSAKKQIGYLAYRSMFHIERILFQGFEGTEWVVEKPPVPERHTIKHKPSLAYDAKKCTFNIGSAKLRYDKMAFSAPSNCTFNVRDEESMKLIEKSVQEGDNVLIRRWGSENDN